MESKIDNSTYTHSAKFVLTIYFKEPDCSTLKDCSSMEDCISQSDYSSLTNCSVLTNRTCDKQCECPTTTTTTTITTTTPIRETTETTETRKTTETPGTSETTSTTSLPEITETTKVAQTTTITKITEVTEEPEQTEDFEFVLVSQEPIISNHIYTNTLADSNSNDYKNLTKLLGFQVNSDEMVEDCLSNGNSLCLESIRVQRFRRESAPAEDQSMSKRRKSRESGSLRTVFFLIANYKFRSLPSEYSEDSLVEGTMVDDAIISLTADISETLSSSPIEVELPDGFGIQSTLSKQYKDPTLLDEELGITQNIIIAAATTEDAAQQVVISKTDVDGQVVTQTVEEIKELISSDEEDEGLQLDTQTLNTFAEVTEKALKEVFGEPMIQSVNAFFVTADKCQAYQVCDAADCRQELHLPGLLTLTGNLPFDLLVFGIPDQLANEIDLKLDATTKEINLKIRNLTVFEEDEFKNNSDFFIRATDAQQREGIINVVIAESSQCLSYQRDNNPEEDITAVFAPEVTREIIQEADLYF